MFYVFSFPPGVYVGTLNLIASVPGPSILTSLKPHFYKVKTGSSGLYLVFLKLFLIQNIHCGFSLESLRQDVSFQGDTFVVILFVLCLGV